MRIFDCIPFSSNFSSTIRRDARRNACVHSKGRSGSEPEGSLVIKGQPLALMRPPATGEGRQLLVRNRTSQDFYDARFLLMDNFRFGVICRRHRPSSSSPLGPRKQTSDALITMSAIRRPAIQLRPPTNACATRRANHASGWSSIPRKNIPLLFSCKSVHSFVRPTR